MVTQTKKENKTIDFYECHLIRFNLVIFEVDFFLYEFLIQNGFCFLVIIFFCFFFVWWESKNKKFTLEKKNIWNDFLMR